jgi:hypothetical protein
VTRNAKPLGELPLRQAGALAQMAQSFRLQVMAETGNRFAAP